MVVRQAVPGRGFDINQPLTASTAKLFKDNGETFVVRYLPRTAELAAGNLIRAEIDVILGAGLNLMAVQHVALPGWVPSAALGTSYGTYAAEYAALVGILPGVTLWLDLEQVATTSTAQAIIDYCTAWYLAVKSKGFVPGIYVGWGTGLTANALYRSLPFQHYWNAYNGPGVAVRGCQIIQHDQRTLQGISYDPDTLQADNKGTLPYWLSPE